MAKIVHAPEFVLTEAESEQLAEASAKVARHYDISASQKTIDWAQLMIVMAAMYGPRFYLISQRRKEEKQQAKAGEMPFGMV